MPSRRKLLAAGCGVITGLAGCGDDGSDTPTGSSTATDRGATTPTEGSLSLALDRRGYLFRTNAVARAVVGPQDHETMALSDLNDATREAVRTAITEARFATSDPSRALLDGIDDVSLVQYRGTYYAVSHTFPTYTLTLESVVPEDAPADRTVSRNSREVQEIEILREPMMTVSPSPSSPGEPYVTTRLSDTLRIFLEKYDYLRYPSGIGELVLTKTERPPPHTVTATTASDQQLYGREVYDLDSLTKASRELVQVTLQSEQKTPLWTDAGTHRVFPDDVPQRLLDQEQLTVTIDGSMYDVRADHVHWNDCPFELSTGLVENSLSSDASARIELRATNRWPEAAKLTMLGIAPFGVLRAYGPDGEQLLWTPEYEQTDDVVLEDGTVRPQQPAELLVEPDERVGTVYEFGWVAEQLERGRYVVPGILWAQWPTDPGQNLPERDWRSDRFPYALTLEVSG